MLDPDELVRQSDRRATSSEPLARLVAAAAVADELRSAGDELLDRYVAAARDAGVSWADIGTTLGVSKQAAHQRFLSLESPARAWPPHGTPAVRAAVAAGCEEARALGHRYLGTEHVLAGFYTEPESTAARALTALDVQHDRVVDRIAAVIGTGTPGPSDCSAVAPRLKRALELARSHARALGRTGFDTEHLLLAFCDIDDCVATVVLRDLGVPPDTVRSAIADLLDVDPGLLRPRGRRRRLRRLHAA